MPTVAVLADPPRPGRVLPALVEEGPLAAGEAADLYTAMLLDACLAVEDSGADLLVNYRAPEGVPDGDAREAVETALSPALDDPGSARYEVQVGSTRSARVGNTVTHLLEEEGARSAAALDPRVSLLARRHLDGAAMKLRQAGVVLGPSPGGRVWYAGFAEPVDFAGAYEPPVLRTLTERARAEDRAVDFLESLPLVETPADLASTLVAVRARERAEQPVPPHTSDVLSDLGLAAEPTDDGLALVRE